MSNKKSTKPSNRKLVFNKEQNKWINLEEEKALMELQKIKMEQAKKTLEDLEDEPHGDEQVVCQKCKEWTSSKEPCCP